VLEGKYLENHHDPTVAKVVLHNFSLPTPQSISACRKDYNDYIFIFPKFPYETLDEDILHEYGHKIGLEHVNNQRDIMYPYSNSQGLIYFPLRRKERKFIESKFQWAHIKKNFKRYFG
jgi:hypothetical protein